MFGISVVVYAGRLLPNPLFCLRILFEKKKPVLCFEKLRPAKYPVESFAINNENKRSLCFRSARERLETCWKVGYFPFWIAYIVLWSSTREENMSSNGNFKAFARCLDKFAKVFLQHFFCFDRRQALFWCGTRENKQLFCGNCLDICKNSYEKKIHCQCCCSEKQMWNNEKWLNATWSKQSRHKLIKRNWIIYKKRFIITNAYWFWLLGVCVLCGFSTICP